MNIFVIDLDHDLRARWHFDKHVVKMQTEGCQMLMQGFYKSFGIKSKKDFVELKQSLSDILTSFPRLDIDGNVSIYNFSHFHHPCTKWVNENISNWMWTIDHCEALNREYTYRYGKIHATTKILDWFRKNPPSLDEGELTPFAKGFKGCPSYSIEDAVEAYRDFYVKEKQHLANWKKREAPPWWESLGESK